MKQNKCSRVKALLILLICSSHLSSYSQKSTLAVDTLTTQLNGPFPFDQPFVLKYSLQGSKAQFYSLDIYEVDKSGCFRTPPTYCDGRKISTAKGQSLRVKLLKQTPTGDGYFFIPPLEPDKKFVIFVNVLLQQDQLKNLLNDLAKNSPNNKLLADYNDLVEKFKPTFTNPYGNCPCNTVQVSLPEFADFQKYLRDSSVSPIIDAVVAQQKRLDDCKKQAVRWCTPGAPVISDKDLAALIRFSQECLKCKDSVWQYQWVSQNKDVNFLMLNLKALEDPVLFTGATRLSNLHPISTGKDPNWDNAVANINLTYNTVDSLIQVIRYYQVKYAFAFSGGADVIAQLEAARDCLKTNYTFAAAIAKDVKDLDSTVKATTAVLNRIVSNFYGFALPAAQITSSSYNFNFTTRADFSLQADIGFLGYRIPPNPHAQYGFAPYLGFHFNFRPLNTNVPFNLIQHLSFWDHLSFNSGVSLTSLTATGKRDGLIGSVAVFTGLGYALSHATRLTAGVLWYRKNDPNPLIDNKTTAAMPYVGLSIDLRLKAITSTFKTFFNL